MKIFIIILLILFIIYLLKNKNKKEFFKTDKKNVQITKKMMEKIKLRLTRKQIADINNIGHVDTNGKPIMSNVGYIDAMNRNIINNFKNQSKEYIEQIEKLHFHKRGSNKFSSKISKNRDVSTRERYLYYLNFINLGEKQTTLDMRRKYNFAIDFISTFKPNVTLTFYLKYKNNDINRDDIINNRIRYEIYKKGHPNDVIFTNFIFCNDLNLNQEGVIIKSDKSGRYEPKINNNYLEYLPKIKEKFDKIDDNNIGFAFEDFTKIRKKDKPYDNGYIKIDCDLFITEGEYYLKIIVDSTTDSNDYIPKINYDLEHNYSVFSKDKIIVEKSPQDFVLNKNNESTNDNDYFLTINSDNITIDFNRFIYQLKDVENKDYDKLPIDENDPANPQRQIIYIEMYLFIIFYQIYLKDKNDEKMDTQLKTIFDLFKLAFEKKYVETRIHIPSTKYKNLDKRANELSIKGRDISSGERAILQNIETKLYSLKNLELLELSPPTFPEKETELSDTYESIDNFKTKIKYYNKYDSINDFISVNFNKNSTLNKESIINCIKYIDNKIFNSLPNDEGKINLKFRSNDTIGSKFPYAYESKLPLFEFIHIKEPKTEMKTLTKPTFIVEKPKPIIKEQTSFDNIWTKIIRLIKKDFKQIIDMKKYDTLDPELELLLKSIKRNSKNSLNDEDKKKYKLILDKTLCLVNLIKEGDIEKINSLIELRTPAFLGPTDSKSSLYLDPDGEAILCNKKFSNYNLMEKFTGINHTLGKNIGNHKHTSEGRVDFKYGWGDPKKKEFEGKYDEYSILNDNQKKNVLKKYYEIHGTLSKADILVDNYLKQIEENSDKLDYNKILKESTQEINQSLSKEKIKEKYNKKEIQQKDKMIKINKKLNQLEKIQNKKYVNDLNEYNSIKSFGDGQIISIKKFKKDIYNILVNEDCLDFDKKGHLSSSKCNNEISQQFSIKNMNNLKDYNKLIHLNNGEIATEYDNIDYPFQIMNPILHKSQCLTLNGNSIGVKECINSNKQRWEGLKKIKICDNFNQN